MGIERRQNKRLDSNLFVDFVSNDKEPLGRGVIIDVSIGGFGVDTETDLEIDKTYECYMEVPLIVKAKLVRREMKGQMKRYGLQFVGLGFFNKLLLRRILKGERATRKVG